jgi:hypothetical protein
MRERDFLASLAATGLQSAVTTIPSLLREAEGVPDLRGNRQKIESFIENSGIPISPVIFIALSVSASFFVFLQMLCLGSLAALCLGGIALYLTLFLLPTELFCRRVRRLQEDLPLVCEVIGKQMLEGSSLDHSLTRCCERGQSLELREILRDAQRRLFISGGLLGLREEVTERGYGVFLSSFLAALHYASLNSSYDAGVMCMHFAEVLRREVEILSRHAAFLAVARSVGVIVVVFSVYLAITSGLLTSQFSVGSTEAHVKEFGAITLGLSLAALLRVTSLSDWERHGKL